MTNNENNTRALHLVGEARYQLERALDALGSARGWGLWDVLGGGFISTLIKHGHMDDADSHIREAKRLLEIAGELAPDAAYLFQEDNHDFARVADWLFDGLASDLYVQSCIADRRRAVEELLSRVNQLESALRGGA